MHFMQQSITMFNMLTCFIPVSRVTIRFAHSEISWYCWSFNYTPKRCNEMAAGLFTTYKRPIVLSISQALGQSSSPNPQPPWTNSTTLLPFSRLLPSLSANEKAVVRLRMSTTRRQCQLHHSMMCWAKCLWGIASYWRAQYDVKRTCIHLRFLWHEI